MPWVRIHDGALSHPKLFALFNWKDPLHVWMWGLSQAQMHLTDGLIVRDSVPKAGLKAASVLVDRRLWDAVDAGWQIHDFLDWNDSKVVVKKRQINNAHRQVFFRDPDLRRALRERDGDRCRYCGCAVNWQDRNGSLGATYDHVDPNGTGTIENLVVACRGCNSRKRDRLPAAAGMRLLPEPTVVSVTRMDLDPDLDFIKEPNQTKPNHLSNKEEEEDPLPPPIPPPAPGLRFAVIEPTARSKRPWFSGQRLVVHEWMLDDCMKALGEHTDAFNLHKWFCVLDGRMVSTGLLQPKRDSGAWLQAELVAEANRRGIHLAVADAETVATAASAAKGPSIRPHEVKP